MQRVSKMLDNAEAIKKALDKMAAMQKNPQAKDEIELLSLELECSCLNLHTEYAKARLRLLVMLTKLREVARSPGEWDRIYDGHLEKDFKREGFDWKANFDKAIDEVKAEEKGVNNPEAGKAHWMLGFDN